MIFIVLGSQKFQFDRLLQQVDELIDQGIIQEEVFAQTGASIYQPRNYPFRAFLNRSEFQDMQKKADTVIAHGGTGAIIGSVKLGKKVIAVPRLARYGEHVDDHQLQIITEFEKMGIIEPCFAVEDLEKAYMASREKTYRPYTGNNEAYLKDLASYLDSI